MKSLKKSVLALFAAITLCGLNSVKAEENKKNEDNALSYVEKRAEWVGYCNTKQVFASKLWLLTEDYEELLELQEEIEKGLYIRLKEFEGNIAVWGTFPPEKREPQIDGAVAILDKDNAENIIDAIKRSIGKRNLQVEDAVINGCKAIVLKRERHIGGKVEFDVELTFVLVNRKIIHVYVGRIPNTILKAENGNKLANQLGRDTILAGAISGDLLRLGMRIAKLKRVPRVGDVLCQIRVNDNKLTVEGSVDISRIR